jgi:hypothetical protein
MLATVRRLAIPVIVGQLNIGRGQKCETPLDHKLFGGTLFTARR